MSEIRRKKLEKLIAERYEGNQSAFGIAIGKTATQVNMWLSGARNMTLDSSEKIEKSLKLPRGWMDDDVHPARHASEPLAAYHVNTEALHNVGKVPLIDWVAAGTWHDISDPYPAGMAEDWLYCPSRHGSRAYALRVRGESMHNPSSDQSFKDGDIIFVDPDKVAINKSLVICRLDDSKQTTFKRLLIDGDSKMLEALNPSWPERIIKVNSNATICGVIIGKYEVY